MMQALKGTPSLPELSLGSKKNNKNGKDGGVVAAVTKHAAGKFSYVSTAPELHVALFV
jgi:hypothetical protein